MIHAQPDPGLSPDADPPDETSAAAPQRSATQRFRDNTAAKSDVPPERDLWQGRYSHRAMIGTWIGGGAATCILLGIGIAFARSAGWWWAIVGAIALLWIGLAVQLKYRQWNVRFRLTTRRFSHERGILTRTTDVIEVIDMDDTTLVQSFLMRLVDVGDIKIESSDRSHPEIWLRGIEHVHEVKEQIDSARRAERERRGIHIESV
jgi:uncharacterized membrane protein YdbT with pleckstrin-like domain